MELTKEIVEAVERAIGSVRTSAGTLSNSEYMKDQGAAGTAVRQGVEKMLQDIDMLEGWAKRARLEVGMPPIDQ